mgnify:CR=1 FL=1
MMKMVVRFDTKVTDYQWWRLLNAKLVWLEKQGRRIVVQNDLVHRLRIKNRPSSKKMKEVIYHDVIIYIDEYDKKLIEEVSEVLKGRPA